MHQYRQIWEIARNSWMPRFKFANFVAPGAVEKIPDSQPLGLMLIVEVYTDI